MTGVTSTSRPYSRLAVITGPPQALTVLAGCLGCRYPCGGRSGLVSLLHGRLDGLGSLLFLGRFERPEVFQLFVTLGLGSGIPVCLLFAESFEFSLIRIIGRSRRVRVNGH